MSREMEQGKQSRKTETGRRKPIILVILSHYLPGFKDGGPVRSILNLTDYLGEEYEFRVLTVDRDQKETTPYEGIVTGQWNLVGKAKVWYVPGGRITSESILEAAGEADMIYMWGCFQDYARKVLFLRKRKKLKLPVAIAPMGMLSPGAFRIKYPKKKTYMSLMKLFGMFRNIVWSVTDEEEREAVKKLAGQGADCRIARDLVSVMGEPGERDEKKKGKLNLVFLSRISLKKNLKYIFEILREIPVAAGESIKFDIYGTKEDEEYYQECVRAAEGLPESVCWEYKGEVKPNRILETLSRYDVFFLPTMSENYGHVIYEAMASGCIPLISDQTPWTDIEEKQAGYCIPLEDKRQFADRLTELLAMENPEFMKLRQNAIARAAQERQNVDLEGYRKIFREASE